MGQKFKAVAAALAEPLSPAKAERRAALEAVLAGGDAAKWGALLRIKEEGLFAPQTWKSYCVARPELAGLSERHIRRKLDEAATRSESGQICPPDAPASWVHALAKLPAEVRGNALAAAQAAGPVTAERLAELSRKAFAGRTMDEMRAKLKESEDAAKKANRERHEQSERDGAAECVKRLDYLLNVRARKLIRQGHVPDPEACEAALDRLLDAVRGKAAVAA